MLELAGHVERALPRLVVKPPGVVPKMVQRQFTSTGRHHFQSLDVVHRPGPQATLHIGIINIIY